jgi:hypothetical protein
LFFLVGTQGQAQSTVPGTATLVGAHRGLINNSAEVTLLVEPLSGREGSYLAVMIQLPSKVMAYRVDPLSKTQFAMNPIQITEDGSLGVPNDNPSLILDQGIGNKGTRRATFSISNANSDNKAGFQGTIDFDGSRDPQISFSRYAPGDFALANDGKNSTVRLSAMADFEGSAFFKTSRGINGGFSVREILPGIYTLRAVTVDSTGAYVDPIPKGILVFVEVKKRFGGNQRMLMLVSPSDYSVVSTFGAK